MNVVALTSSKFKTLQEMYYPMPLDFVYKLLDIGTKLYRPCLVHYVLQLIPLNTMQGIYDAYTPCNTLLIFIIKTLFQLFVKAIIC